MSKAVYSPCNLCPEDPNRAPLWQIKAVRVTHDSVSKDVAYHDATMEILGIPVGYVPYFSQSRRYGGPFWAPLAARKRTPRGPQDTLGEPRGPPKQRQTKQCR